MIRKKIWFNFEESTSPYGFNKKSLLIDNDIVDNAISGTDVYENSKEHTQKYFTMLEQYKRNQFEFHLSTTNL